MVTTADYATIYARYVSYVYEITSEQVNWPIRCRCRTDRQLTQHSVLSTRCSVLGVPCLVLGTFSYSLLCSRALGLSLSVSVSQSPVSGLRVCCSPFAAALLACPHSASPSIPSSLLSSSYLDSDFAIFMCRMPPAINILPAKYMYLLVIKYYLFHINKR